MPLPSAWKTGLAGRWEAKAAGCGRRRTLPPGASHAARRGECHRRARSEEHTSELQSLMRISYAVFCLKKKKDRNLTCNTRQQKIEKQIPQKEKATIEVISNYVTML